MMLLNTLCIIVALLTWGNIGASDSWNGWSPNDNNDRYQRTKLPVILATKKTDFKQLWYTKLSGPVQGSPTIYENYVYVPTTTGTFYSLKAASGEILWQRNLSSIINNGFGYYSRTSPLVSGNLIILGLIENTLQVPKPGHGAYVIAVNRFSGAPVWKTKVSSHPAALITATPQLANNRLFVGISSLEESLATIPSYRCCSFQGSVLALNVDTGKLLWETKMIPDNKGTTTGYSGGAVWGSQFPVDHKRDQIYIATGNYYDVPASVEKCVNETRNLTVLTDPCDQPTAYGNAILALDMSTGIIRWSQKRGPIDAWNGACVSAFSSSNINCPPNPGPDFDFGQAPVLQLNLPYKFGGKNRDQLFVGQKSGIVFGLDAETGTVTWSNQVSPGSFLAGIQFGSAADGQYVYVGNNNFFGTRYTLPSGTTTTKASWAALDLVTGKAKWATVDPTTNINQTSAYHPLTVWDQLILVQGGSQPAIPVNPLKGCVYGLNKKNGQVLYEKCVPNTPIGNGASVAGNTIFVSIGYGARRVATDGVLALQLP